MVGMFISTATFFLFNVENIVEFSVAFKSLYISSSELHFMICFVVNICKMRNILQLIEKYERFIRKSKFMKFISIIRNFVCK